MPSSDAPSSPDHPVLLNAAPIPPAELTAIYDWVDSIPLSRPKKNIARDFSDGVLLAEIVAHVSPKAIELHNYSRANSAQQKHANWDTLNAKVFKKMGIVVPRPDVDACVASVTGAIEKVLRAVRPRLLAYKPPEPGPGSVYPPLFHDPYNPYGAAAPLPHYAAPRMSKAGGRGHVPAAITPSFLLGQPGGHNGAGPAGVPGAGGGAIATGAPEPGGNGAPNGGAYPGGGYLPPGNNGLGNNGLGNNGGVAHGSGSSSVASGRPPAAAWPVREPGPLKVPPDGHPASLFAPMAVAAVYGLAPSPRTETDSSGASGGGGYAGYGAYGGDGGGVAGSTAEELVRANGLLESKVRKLEQLVKLKDTKIATLAGRLRAAGIWTSPREAGRVEDRAAWIVGADDHSAG